MSWRTEVLDPATMTTEDIRAELRHDLDVYERLTFPLSKAAMARRIERLVAEMDSRQRPVPFHGDPGDETSEQP